MRDLVFLSRSAIYLTLSLGLVASVFADTADRPPNIIYVLADDLGYGELGCYGQEKIKTPNIDSLAKNGIRFTQHYSGSPVCASSRCVLMTGKHTGHAYIRGNTEKGGWGPDEPEGQYPLLDREITIAELLKQKKYRTAAIGKWGLGGPGSEGHPNFQGFDFFYGYLCQRVAHNYYPTHLWHNHDVDVLGNKYFKAHQRIKNIPQSEQDWDQYQGSVYATDRMIEEAEDFIKENKERPFFLYYATNVPHVALQVPNDSLEHYKGKFDDAPYLGNKGYLPHRYPRAAYAAMITRMDRNVGRIVNLVDQLGLKENTIVMFSSDNGPTFNGGSDSNFFESAKHLRGLKTSVFEGGIRVPMIACWPGRIEPGVVSQHVSAFQDVMPTLCDIVQVKTPDNTDGVSFMPTLLGNHDKQPQHKLLYWELRQQQAMRMGDWKLVRKANKNGEVKNFLFNLSKDDGEQRNLADSNPDQLAKMINLAQENRTRSELFPSPFDEPN